MIFSMLDGYFRFRNGKGPAETFRANHHQIGTVFIIHNLSCNCFSHDRALRTGDVVIK